MNALIEEEGYTKSYRRKWRNPVFRNLRDAGVWAWMIDAAAWRPCAVRFCDRLVTLQRGQLVTSERFIADGFRVDRQVIRRLLGSLEANQMVSLQKTHGGTIVTLCNYDKYQAVVQVENPAENPGQTQVEPTPNPNKNEGKKDKKDIPIANAIGAAAPGLLDLRAELWKRGRAFLAQHGFDRDAAGSLLGKWRKSGGDTAVINALAAAEAECAQDVVPFIEACLKRGKNGSSSSAAPEDRSAFRGGLARAALARMGPGEPAVPDDLARRDPASVG